MSYPDNPSTWLKDFDYLQYVMRGNLAKLRVLSDLCYLPHKYYFDGDLRYVRSGSEMVRPDGRKYPKKWRVSPGACLFNAYRGIPEHSILEVEHSEEIELGCIQLGEARFYQVINGNHRICRRFIEGYPILKATVKSIINVTEIGSVIDDRQMWVYDRQTFASELFGYYMVGNQLSDLELSYAYTLGAKDITVEERIQNEKA